MSFVVSMVIRTTLMLLFGGVLTLFLRRGSASMRHAVWAITIASVVVTPLAMRVLPELQIPNKPDSMPARWQLAEPLAVAPGSLVWQNSPAEQAQASRALALAIVAWVAGAVFVLGRFALGARAVRTMLHEGDGGLRPQILTEIRKALGIRRRVQLALTEREISPMTWGLFRPVVIAPSRFTVWPESRQRAVLSHELAHVKRLDGVVQFLALASCSLYWFNPLVWFALYRMRMERERACDDQALRLGLDPADYATHLLEVARTLGQAKFGVAVSMAEHSQLETRLVAILDQRVNRKAVSRQTAAALLCGVSAAAFMLWTVGPARTEPLASAAITAQTPDRSLTPPKLITTIIQPAYTPEAFQNFVEGGVAIEATVDTNGRIIASRVVRGLGYGLDETSLAEVKTWRFTPASRNGSPVQTTLDLDVDFKLAKAAIPLGMGIEPPVIVSRIEPQHTDASRAAHASGTVILETVAKLDGSVEVLRVIQPLGYGLTESAIQALRQWTFQPGRKDGVRLPVLMNVSIVFDWR